MSCDDCKNNDATSRTQARRRPGNSSVILLDLTRDRVFSATSPVASALFDEHVLTGAEFESLGPGIQDIVVHAEGDNFTANFTYQIGLQFRFRNGPWTTVNVLPLQSSGAYAISSPFTDRTKLGMRVRLVLQTQVSAGTSNPQHGNLNLAAAVRMFST